jgi:hypothetical protein
MPGQTAPTAPSTLFKSGCFDADNINAINTNLTNVQTGLTNTQSQSPGLVGTPINNAAVAFGNYTTGGTANTLLAAGHTAGTYRVTMYQVITTTFTVATTVGCTIGYTDDQGARTVTNALGALTAGTLVSSTTTFRSTGVAAITATQIATGSNAGAGAMAHSAFVERLV